jgi:biopolymer transport protein ExbD
MDFPRTRRKKIEISLIPLIDVSMFLLIFFMVAGTVEKFDLVPIDPPVSRNGNMMDEGHIEVLLGTHDEVILDDEIVTIEDMQKTLAGLLADNPSKVVTVKADAVVPANRMIEVMDAIKAAGGHHLSVLTQSVAKVDKK